MTHAADEGEEVRVRLDGRIAVVAGRHRAGSSGPDGVVRLAEGVAARGGVWLRVWDSWLKQR